MLTSKEVFGRRGHVTSGPNGTWQLGDQDVTKQVNELIEKNWVRVSHFCGGSCIRARPGKNRVG